MRRAVLPCALLVMACQEDPTVTLIEFPPAPSLSDSEVFDMHPDRPQVVAADAAPETDGGDPADLPALGDGGGGGEPCPAPVCSELKAVPLGRVLYWESVADGTRTGGGQARFLASGRLGTDLQAVGSSAGGACELHRTDCAGCSEEGPSLGVGDVVLEGVESLPMTPGADNAYSLPQAEDLWESGTAVSVRADDSFEVAMNAPPEFDDTQPHAGDSVSRAAGLVLRWNTTTAAFPNDEVEVELHGALSDYRVRCTANADAGALTVPTEVLAWVEEEHATVMFTYRTRAESPLGAEDGATVSVTLESRLVVGTISLGP